MTTEYNHTALPVNLTTINVRFIITYMNHDISIINQYLDALLFTLKKHGIERAELLKGINLDDENILFNIGNLIRIWGYAVNLTKDECLGFDVGRQLQLGAYGRVGSIIIYSENVGTALKQAVRFYSLINIGGTISLQEESNVVLVYQPAKKPFWLTHNFIECVITGFVNFLKYAFPLELRPLKVEFTHPPPKDINSYEVFFNCPVVFNANRCCISFDNDALNYKISTADKYLFDYHVNNSEMSLSKENRKPWIRMVKDIIFKESDWSSVTSNMIAHSLGITQRKMQRILYLEDTNFKRIFDEIRKEKAKLLVLQKQFSLIEISEMLGYSDSTSFHRAYKRWYGLPPKNKFK